MVIHNTFVMVSHKTLITSACFVQFVNVMADHHKNVLWITISLKTYDMFKRVHPCGMYKI